MVIDACRLTEIQGKRYDSMSLQSGGAKACGAVFDWDITVLSRPVKYSSIIWAWLRSDFGAYAFLERPFAVAITRPCTSRSRLSVLSQMSDRQAIKNRSAKVRFEDFGLRDTSSSASSRYRF